MMILLLLMIRYIDDRKAENRHKKEALLMFPLNRIDRATINIIIIIHKIHENYNQNEMHTALYLNDCSRCAYLLRTSLRVV